MQLKLFAKKAAGIANFSAENLTFQSLTTYSQLVHAAIARGDLNQSQLATLTDWQKSPETWA